MHSSRQAESAAEDKAPRLPFAVVGVGASAGGLEAFTEFLRPMPADTGMAFVLIQHLPPDRESLLSEILSKRTPMPVLQVEDGMAVQPNHVYLIRPGNILTIDQGRLHLGAPLETPGHRRPVDDFFRSLAEEQRERAIGVILSGMDSNGTAGASVIKAVGGIMIAQDPESAKFPGMPRNLIQAGLADFVLKPGEMSEVLIRYANHPYAAQAESSESAARQNLESLNDILAVLRVRTRHDFDGYKKGTVVRRIQRRMGLGQITDMREYARLLRTNPSEVSELADDLMIHVTGFFRDGALVWETIISEVIAPLVQAKENNSEIRCWVAACSSGEEAYTLAILLLEMAEKYRKTFDIKIFATDTAQRSLTHARTGVYPGGIEDEISADRLKRFFERDDGLYRVKKELREMVLFAPQNILRDPPFSRIDICSCRNLLIYLEPEAQLQALAAIHFGLLPGGALLLGSSETISTDTGMFAPIDKRIRLYRRVGPTRYNTLSPLAPRPEKVKSISPEASKSLGATIAQNVNRLLLKRFTPAAVVIDRQQEVVYYHGDTSRFLDNPSGEPTRDLLALTREFCRGAVRTSVQRALGHEGEASATDGILETSQGKMRVNVITAPMDASQEPRHFLISFLLVAEPEPISSGQSGDGSNSEEINQLRLQLQRSRDELQSTIEELQSSNEEMKASNEEAMSINEELQSANEELESSKEELQSLNEELSTVNSQLEAKMEELGLTTDDLASLLSSTSIAVLFLDTQFRIRRFTPAMKDLLQLIPGDVGRPLQDLARKFKDPGLLADAATVLESLIPIEKEIASDNSRVFIRRMLPYRTMNNRIEGIVITFFDVTEGRKAAIEARDAIEHFEIALEAADMGVWDANLSTMQVKTTFRHNQVFGYTEPVTEWSPEIFRRHVLPEYRQQAHDAFDAALKTGEFELSVPVRWPDGTVHWVLDRGRVYRDSSGKPIRMTGVTLDVTQQKAATVELARAKEAAESANTAKDHFLAMVSHELRTPLAAMLLWSKMLEEGSDQTPEQLREGLHSIRRSAEAQKELVEDLLDTSRIVAGKLRLQLQRVDLAETIKAAVESIRLTAELRNVKIETSLDPAVGVIMADPSRMQQIIWNLLSNAVKFSPEGAVIVSTLRQQNTVEIKIKDNGVGIKPEFLPMVFRRFEQAPGQSGEAGGGLGLGLAITKQLAELHSGTIVAQSEGLRKGTTFTLRFDFPAVSPTSDAAPVKTASMKQYKQLHGLRVLLVEDNDQTRTALTRLFRAAQIDVTAVESVAAAMEAFSRQSPDLILSDIGLGDGDGFMLIRQIRQLERDTHRPTVPAIALTAYVDEERKIRDSGFQRYLVKPIDPAVLLGVLTAFRGSRF